MKLSEFFNDTKPITIDEVGIDNVGGMGNVPHNQNVDYRGLRVLMKPLTFLKLASHIGRNDREGVVDKIKSNILAGEKIASPFLIIKIPNEWLKGDLTKSAQVIQHEGRHRMMAVYEIEGNDPVEVHLIFEGEVRNRHITPEMKKRLNQSLKPEGLNLEYNGPFFVHGHIDTELDEVYPGQSSGKLKNFVKRKYGGEINCKKAAAVKADPDISNFYKKRASWYQSLHCKGRNKMKTVNENDCNCDNCNCGDNCNCKNCNCI